jgi:hypothetical protein
MGHDEGLDALLSAFICNPELSSVKYDGKKDIIKIEAALNAAINEADRTEFLNRCSQSIRLLMKTRGVEPVYFQLGFQESSGVTILRLYRDSLTLSEEEIELYVKLLRQSFYTLLISDDQDLGAGAFFNGELKRTLLKKIKQSQDDFQNIFAYRNEGRVYVFNK